VRATWDEVNEIIAAANAYTAKKRGPDRVFGFSPIPAMSMVSYAAGARYLSLLGGVCMSVLRLVLRPAAGQPADLGRADRRSGKRRLVQRGLPHAVGLERAADAHAGRALLYRGALQGRQVGRHHPRLFRSVEVRRLWLSPSRAPTRRSAMAMGHVILTRVPRDRQAVLPRTTCRKYTDMPMLVRLVKQDGHFVPSACCAPRDFADAWRNQQSRLEDRRHRREVRRSRRAERLDRLPLGRAGQVEPGGEGRQPAPRPSCA
jgi:nitrate reductase alpha subunit